MRITTPMTVQQLEEQMRAQGQGATAPPPSAPMPQQWGPPPQHSSPSFPPQVQAAARMGVTLLMVPCSLLRAMTWTCLMFISPVAAAAAAAHSTAGSSCGGTAGCAGSVCDAATDVPAHWEHDVAAATPRQALCSRSSAARFRCARLAKRGWQCQIKGDKKIVMPLVDLCRHAAARYAAGHAARRAAQLRCNAWRAADAAATAAAAKLAPAAWLHARCRAVLCQPG